MNDEDENADSEGNLGRSTTERLGKGEKRVSIKLLCCVRIPVARNAVEQQRYSFVLQQVL